MRPKKSLFIVIFLSLILPPAQAEKNEMEEYFNRHIPMNEETLLVAASGEKLWWDFSETLDGHSAREQNSAFEKIKHWKTSHGYEGLPALSSALVYRASKITGKWNRKDQPVSLLGKSLELDPLIPDNYFALAKIHMKQFHFIDSIGNFLKGFSASLGNISGRYYLISDLLFLLVCAFFLVGAVFASVLLFKHFPCLKHDFLELFAKNHSPEVITFLLWVFLFLPFLIGAGLFWAMAFWLVLLYKYMRKREKALTLAMLIFVCLVNPLFDLALTFYRDYPTSYVQSSLGMVRKGYNPVLINELEKLLEKSPEDLQCMFFLANLYQEGGKYDEAIMRYRAILDKDPARFDIYLNIGNIYFINRRNNLAIENYNRSIELNPEYAAAYYNASITYAKGFNFEKAAEYKKEALKYDESILIYAGEDRIFMNSPTPRMIHERIREKLKEDFLNHPRRTLKKEEFHEARFRFFGSQTVVPGVFFLLLLLGLSFTRKDRPYAVICRKCGSVYCGKCQPLTGPDKFCSQCHHLFIKRDGIAPQAKKVKMESIQDYHKKQRLVISLMTVLIPGSGHLYLDFSLAGFLMVSIWALSILYIVFKNLLLENPLKALDAGIPFVSAICVFVLALVYLIANLRIHVRRV